MRLPFMFAFVGALLLLFASKAQADQPLTLEYRGIAFTYRHGVYERVIDMFDHGFKTREECETAARAGIRAVSASLSNGDGIIGACTAVPVLPTT